MLPKKHPVFIAILSLFILTFFITACSPAAAGEIEVTRIVPQTVVVTEIVEVIITATPEPAAAEPATPEPAPTATPDKLTMLEDGFNAWCLPRNTSALVARINPDGSMPQSGVAYQNVDGIPEITTQVASCTFAFSFNIPVEESLELRFLDNNGFAFQTSPLMPVDGASNMVYSSETHQYIINPPFWQIAYEVQVTSESGEVLWTSPVSFRRGWEPAKCYYGEWPNPVDCSCPPLPESHPTDAWWGWFPPYPDGCPY